MFPHTLKTFEPILGAWRWVALLVVLGFPLACDHTTTGPVAPPRPPIETSLFPPVTFSPFDASQYFPIDVQRAAQQQWGLSATVTSVANHLYGWRAVVNGQQYSIDMRRAVRDQYGADYVLGAVGVGLHDWVAVHWSALPAKVLPVMVIASDYFYNVSAVQTGLSNLQSVLLTTDAWYRAAYSTAISSFPNPPQPGKTFNLLKPLVVFDYWSNESSSYTAAQWIALGANPSALVSDASYEYSRVYPPHSLGGPTGTAVRVLLAVYAGNGLTVPIGGGGGVSNGLYGANGLPPYTALSGLAIVPPAVSGLSCSWGTGGDGLLYDIPCARATWLTGHELGYTFGLQNCDPGGGPYDCLDSIMGAGYPLPPATVLTLAQVSTLSGSGFFF